MSSIKQTDPVSIKSISLSTRTALISAFLWINVSEVFRYFMFVMPMTRAAMRQVSDPAPMNLPVFLIWGVWDMLLFACVSFVVWLYFERFGGGAASIVKVGTLVWVAIFGLFWIATWNMNMTQTVIPLVALPLAWLEMTITAAILEYGWRCSRSTEAR